MNGHESPKQVIVLLDADAPVDVGSVLVHVPPGAGERHQLALTDVGYERVGSRSDLNWDLLLDAVRRLAEGVSKLRDSEGAPLEMYVAGLAPLAAFFVFGTFFDGRTARITAINFQRTDSTWQAVPLAATAGPPFFAPVSGVDPTSLQHASGRVLVFISTQVPTCPIETIRPALVRSGEHLAGVVQIATATATELDSTNIGGCLAEITSMLSSVAAVWPARSGLAIVLAGPSHLALAAGLAVNANQYLGGSASIDLLEYAGGSYEVVARLPLPTRLAPQVPDDPTSRSARQRVFELLGQEIVGLQRELLREHVRVPAGLLSSDEQRAALADRVFADLGRLTLADQPVGQDFWLSVLHAEMRFGHGLLHALVEVDEETLASLGPLFVLHELVHDPQHVTSNTYRGIGRAAVALEDVDFWADAFAVSVAFESTISREGPDAARRVLVHLIDAHLAAMRAFDRMEQGVVLATLPERRLRRYLIWALQRARAATIRSPDHARMLLDARVCAEISLIKGRLDDRDDKIVLEARADAELFVTAGARLVRMSSRPGLAPAEMIDAVRTFDERRLNVSMDHVVDAGRDVLATWFNG